MTDATPDHYHARIDGDFVIFLIGMRINKPWKLWHWWPIFTAMPRMIRELESKGPEVGFLGHTPVRPLLTVQYWRSFEQLEAYARSRDAAHWPAWTAFNKRMKGNRHNVGLWHELYRIQAGSYETVYSGMPHFGMGSFAELLPIGKGAEAARDRFSRPA